MAMTPLQLIEGRLVVEFGIRDDGEQGFTVEWPADITKSRMISALELAKGMLVLETLRTSADVEEEEDDPDAP